ncbi:2-dehydro-3-deoxyphosphogluconate aldolase [Streptomyces sp. SID11233]|nr:2-dehydro-3-deoxyphosphogluconate aldolase [Streptomyces sp. SID11233]
MSAEVVVCGEAMLLMPAEPGVPLEHALSFRRSVAGAESNVAAGLARLGHSVRRLGRVGDDPAGRSVLAQLRARGVDTGYAVTDPEAPTGVLIRESHPEVDGPLPARADVVLAGEDELEVPGIPDPAALLESGARAGGGADALKLLPASALPPGRLRDVRAALPQAPVLPTGGVTIDNAPQWTAAGAVACGMGSALTSGGARASGERVSTLLRTLAGAR